MVPVGYVSLSTGEAAVIVTRVRAPFASRSFRAAEVTDAAAEMVATPVKVAFISPFVFDTRENTQYHVTWPSPVEPDSALKYGEVTAVEAEVCVFPISQPYVAAVVVPTPKVTCMTMLAEDTFTTTSAPFADRADMTEV
jgi:hypothetical protein